MHQQDHSSHRDVTPPLRQTRSSRPARRLVLCIDDESSELAIRKLLLEDAGYDVLTSMDGRTGLEMFSTMPIQVVVLDYSMPSLNGAEVANAMRAIKPHVPIVMLSGNPDPPEKVREAVDVYVVKGGQPRDLLDSVEQLFAGDEESRREASGGCD